MDQSSKTTVNNKEVSKVNPALIFQRLCALMIKSKNLAEFIDLFWHELSDIPPAIFDQLGMRKNTKSDLYEFFETTDTIFDREYCHFIVYGCMFIEKIT